MPTKPSEVHSAHSRAHAALGSKKTKCNRYNGFVQSHVTYSHLHKKSTHMHDMSSPVKPKHMAVQSEHVETKIKTADVGYSSQMSKGDLGPSGKQCLWSTAQDLTCTHETPSSSTFSLAAHGKVTGPAVGTPLQVSGWVVKLPVEEGGQLIQGAAGCDG